MTDPIPNDELEALAAEVSDDFLLASLRDAARGFDPVPVGLAERSLQRLTAGGEPGE